MGSNLSIAQIVAELEAQISHHKAQVEVHATQETLHREKKAYHAAELEKLSRYLEDFRKSSDAILEIAGIQQVTSSQQGRDDQRSISDRARFGSLILAVLEDKSGTETFSATELAREIEQRFGKRMDKARRVEPRSIASQLRRMVRRGELHLAQEGRAHHEALYSKNRPRG